MVEPFFKQPRVYDAEHLKWIGQQPCCICGDNTTVEAAHLRVASINHDKRETGMAEKSSDSRWVVPLCGAHHREQHSMNEMAFWSKYGLDPFALCLHYARRQ